MPFPSIITIWGGVNALNHRLEVGERRSLASHYTLTTGSLYRSSIVIVIDATMEVRWYVILNLDYNLTNNSLRLMPRHIILNALRELLICVINVWNMQQQQQQHLTGSWRNQFLRYGIISNVEWCCAVQSPIARSKTALFDVRLFASATAL